jgi:hypothetical protein
MKLYCKLLAYEKLQLEKILATSETQLEQGREPQRNGATKVALCKEMKISHDLIALAPLGGNSETGSE